MANTGQPQRQNKEHKIINNVKKVHTENKPVPFPVFFDENQSIALYIESWLSNINYCILSKQKRSSLPYQVLLYINAWYFGFFFLCEILIFIFKGETLPYAENVLPAEVILVFILAGIEALRIFFAQKGNLTERIPGVVVSILLSIPAILGAIFLLLWQTYVLRIDVILAAIQLAFLGLELIFGIISIITFARVAHPIRLEILNWFVSNTILSPQNRFDSFKVKVLVFKDRGCDSLKGTVRIFMVKQLYLITEIVESVIMSLHYQNFCIICKIILRVFYIYAWRVDRFHKLLAPLFPRIFDSNLAKRLVYKLGVKDRQRLLTWSI
ncbi:hypothetical protein KUTeg_007170 [Tegillarca granosa]|uniref:Transmembrane protein n=1 Tax=Tegillarca granosa TaxID=220873 RepID=A0ABQ9FCG9_TEGGR|nr:hypothetical protein KUTeg_007170 [Tegillarca granosa]